MLKIILLKYFNNKCSGEELIIWVKKEAFKKDGKNRSFYYWKRFEPELNIYGKKKLSILLNKIYHKINLKHRKKESGKVIVLSKITKWLSFAATILFIPLIGIVFNILSNSIFQMNKISNLIVDSIEDTTPFYMQNST